MCNYGDVGHDRFLLEVAELLSCSVLFIPLTQGVTAMFTCQQMEPMRVCFSTTLTVSEPVLKGMEQLILIKAAKQNSQGQ